MRRMYLTIVALLVISTGLLLGLLGLTVYHELNEQLTRDGQSLLQQMSESVHDAVRDSIIGGKEVHPMGAPEANDHDLRDDRGDMVYYYAKTPQGLVDSDRNPLPYTVITHQAAKDGFTELVYHSDHYRVYGFTIVLSEIGDKQPIQAYAYAGIGAEKNALQHTEHLMWIVGGIGFLFALLGNLLLARRFMRPTLQTWKAYRDTVLQLSHELQTPLATVNAMMSSRHVDPVTAADVSREIDRASQMVSDMLFLSRVKSGVAVQPSIPVAVSDMTEDIANNFAPLAGARGIQLTGTADPGLFVVTTPGEWERLVSTLFKNVIDHGAPNTLATWQLHQNGRHIELCVENEIAVDAKAEATRPPERGVGLEIVRHLTRRLKGRIEIRSKESKYSVSVVVLSRRPRW